MILQIARACGALVMLVALATTAPAQRILDWPLRTTAGPEAVTRGVEAAFWNPAGISSRHGRGEVLIADQRAPAEIGIGGFAAAATWRLDARTNVAAGYQHVSIDDIGETTSSPLPDNGAGTFSIAEDQIAIGVSHILGRAVSAGAGVRFDRSNETGFDESTTSLTAGFLVMPALPLRPTLGMSFQTQPNGVRYAGALEIATQVQPAVELRAGYGLRGGENMIAVEHKVGATLDWKKLVSLTGGVATASAGSDRTYEPVLGASLRVSRYELGVIREALSNDFGAAYSFRFRLGLK